MTPQYCIRKQQNAYSQLLYYKVHSLENHLKHIWKKPSKIIPNFNFKNHFCKWNQFTFQNLNLGHRRKPCPGICWGWTGHLGASPTQWRRPLVGKSSANQIPPYLGHCNYLEHSHSGLQGYQWRTHTFSPPWDIVQQLCKKPQKITWKYWTLTHLSLNFDLMTFIQTLTCGSPPL